MLFVHTKNYYRNIPDLDWQHSRGIRLTSFFVWVIASFYD
jgi:hypothetical protein